VLNPALTLPLLLLGRYTTRGNILASEHATAFKHLRNIVGLGLIRSLSAWLDTAVTNNWSKDTYDWDKEIVVVTGGSDGIGKAIVHLLAEKGIKVAVLDVQKLTYEGTASPNLFMDPKDERILTNLSAPNGPLLPMRPLLPRSHHLRRLPNTLRHGQPHRADQQRGCRARQDDP
jgi:hypothetical protein